MIQKLHLDLYLTQSKQILYIGILLLIPRFTHAQLVVATDVYIASGAEMYVAVDQTSFEFGQVIAERGSNYGVLSFAPNATWDKADHNAHVNGMVRIYDPSSFSFPIGHDDILQPAQLQQLDQLNPVDMSFVHSTHSNLSKETGIEKISDEFYWTVAGNQPAYLSLSWNAFSNVDLLTDNTLQNLGIAGYDGTTWRKIETELDDASFHDGSNSTVLTGSISSKNPVHLEGYEAFTLVAVSADVASLLNVSQGFTPNGDGINDTWYIENIESFPNAHIRLYSRWGREVFVSLGNYQNDWNGTFKNYSEPVADGSYAYVIDLEGDGKMDLSGWVYITR